MDEQRVYAAWSEGTPQRGEINKKSGIIECKNVLNKLHFELGAKGFNQVYGEWHWIQFFAGGILFKCQDYMR